MNLHVGPSIYIYIGIGSSIDTNCYNSGWASPVRSGPRWRRGGAPSWHPTQRTWGFWDNSGRFLSPAPILGLWDLTAAGNSTWMQGRTMPRNHRKKPKKGKKEKKNSDNKFRMASRDKKKKHLKIVQKAWFFGPAMSSRAMPAPFFTRAMFHTKFWNVLKYLQLNSYKFCVARWLGNLSSLECQFGHDLEISETFPQLRALVSVQLIVLEKSLVVIF